VRPETRGADAHASVGTRIYAAIAVTAALTVVATAVAFWSFAEVGQTMRQLVEDRFPVVEISLDLADAASAAVAVARRLADAETPQDLDAQMDRLAAGERRMRQQVANLPGTTTEDKARIVAQIDRLAGDLKEAYQSARERLAQVAGTRERVADLVKVQEQLTQLFVSMADDALFDLTLGMETAGSEQEPEALKKGLKSLSEKELPVYGGTLSIAAETNQLYGLLREVAVLGSRELLVPSRERFTAIAERLSKALAAVEKTGDDAKRRSAVERLLAFGSGANSLFALREREFDTQSKLAQTLGAAVVAATALQKEVQGRVVSARSAAHEASVETGALIATNSWLLGAISLSGVGIAFAIALFYVRLGTAAANMDQVSDVVSTEARVAEEKIGISSQHVSDTAGSTEDLALTIRRIEDEARKSNVAVGEALEQFQRAVGTISTLDDAASRIDEVVGLIQTIAGRTNLLALNAKIEAARAGEAGKGFSVVAEEVKSLAGQTAKATEDVTAQINAIQAAANDARHSMTELDAIIAQVSRMVESVAETVAEQSMSVANISNGANFASTEAKSGSEAISRVAHVSAGARATAGEVKSLAGTVANDAERLDEHVERFLQAVRAA